MSLHRLQDVNNLPDPLKQYQFTFCISKVRGSNGIAGAAIGEFGDGMTDAKRSERLELQCSSYFLPGSKVYTQETVIFGHHRARATVQDKAGKWKTTLYETMDGAVISMVRNWLDAIYNPLTGIGLPSELYISTCEVKMKTPKTEKSIYLRGFYPVEMSNVQIDASSSNPVQVDVLWNYDWFAESSFLNKASKLLGI